MTLALNQQHGLAFDQQSGSQPIFDGAVQFPSGTNDFWESAFPQPGIDADDLFTVGAWIKPKGFGGYSQKTVFPYMGWGSPSESQASEKGVSGFSWYYANRIGYGAVQGSLDGQPHGVREYLSGAFKNLGELWFLFLYGRAEDGHLYQRFIEMDTTTIYSEPQGSKYWDDKRALLADTGEGACSWVLGTSFVYDNMAGDCALSHVFRVDEWIPDSGAISLAAGATIADLGYEPTNWYRLNDKTDQTDYGQQGNHLHTVGDDPITVPGPPVMRASSVDNNMYLKQSGIFRNAKPSAKVNGAWMPWKSGWIKDAGVWKQFYATDA